MVNCCRSCLLPNGAPTIPQPVAGAKPIQMATQAAKPRALATACPEALVRGCPHQHVRPSATDIRPRTRSRALAVGRLRVLELEHLVAVLGGGDLVARGVPAPLVRSAVNAGLAARHIQQLALNVEEAVVQALRGMAEDSGQEASATQRSRRLSAAMHVA